MSTWLGTPYLCDLDAVAYKYDDTVQTGQAVSLLDEDTVTLYNGTKPMFGLAGVKEGSTVSVVFEAQKIGVEVTEEIAVGDVVAAGADGKFSKAGLGTLQTGYIAVGNSEPMARYTLDGSITGGKEEVSGVLINFNAVNFDATNILPVAARSLEEAKAPLTVSDYHRAVEKDNDAIATDEQLADADAHEPEQPIEINENETTRGAH